MRACPVCGNPRRYHVRAGCWIFIHCAGCREQLHDVDLMIFDGKGDEHEAA